MAGCVEKGTLHFSHILKEYLLEKDLRITPKMSKLKIPHRNVCLSKKKAFWKLPVPKTGWMGPGLAPGHPELWYLWK